MLLGYKVTPKFQMLTMQNNRQLHFQKGVYDRTFKKSSILVYERTCETEEKQPFLKHQIKIKSSMIDTVFL